MIYDDDDSSHGNRNLLRTLVASMMMTMIIINIITLISTEGAHRRPLTYDDHPIPIPSIRTPYSIEDDLSWTKMNY